MATNNTVHTAFEIIEAVQEIDGATITELSEHLGLAKSTIHRHVKTLEKERYVVAQNREINLGLRFLNHGIYARDKQPGYQAAREKVREIAEETGELCTFIVKEHHMGYLLCRIKGPNAVETGDWIGKPVHLHATAGGKCILAHSDSAEIETVIERTGLPAQTANTITDKETLFEELAKVRENGVAINREEHIDGLNAVAVPIPGKNQEILGSLVISGPTNRVNGQRLETDLPDLLLGASNELELNLTYS
mgnify:CR=1 FL=1